MFTRRFQRVAGSVLAVVMLLNATVFGACPCQIRELQAAETATCPSYSDGNGCGLGVSLAPQYYACADAGTGESGRVDCDATSQQISTWYPCEEDFQTGTFILCVTAVVACAADCVACIAEPTKLTCIVCSACTVGAGTGCLIADYMLCTKGTGQPTYRSVFSSLSGANCTGQ